MCTKDFLMFVGAESPLCRKKTFQRQLNCFPLFVPQCPCFWLIFVPSPPPPFSLRRMRQKRERGIRIRYCSGTSGGGRGRWLSSEGGGWGGGDTVRNYSAPQPGYYARGSCRNLFSNKCLRKKGNESLLSSYEKNKPEY